MEQQLHRTCQRTKSKEKQNVLLFVLIHKQCNGIIKGYLHCLTPESIGIFLVNNILMFDSACLVMARIQFSLIIKKRLDVQNVIKIALVNFVIHLSINLTYDSIIGLFPDYMMILKVTPVFKGGAVQIFVISGPYLYLYVFSKILERLMYNRLYKHLLI